MSINRPQTGWNITRTPVHPGEMLREEFMKPLGISINRLALGLHVPVTRISEIVNELRRHSRYGSTFGPALRNHRRFLDEPPERLRTDPDSPEIDEAHRKTSPAPQHRGVAIKMRYILNQCAY